MVSFLCALFLLISLYIHTHMHTQSHTHVHTLAHMKSRSLSHQAKLESCRYYLVLDLSIFLYLWTASCLFFAIFPALHLWLKSTKIKTFDIMQPFNPDRRKHWPGTSTILEGSSTQYLTLFWPPPSMFPLRPQTQLSICLPASIAHLFLREAVISLNTAPQPQILLPWMLSSVHLEKAEDDSMQVRGTWQRPPLLITSWDGKALGVLKRMRNFFSLPLMFIDLSSSLRASLNVLLSCFCFVAWVQKRILQIDRSSQPLLGMNSYYFSFSGLSSHVHIPQHI